MKSSCQRLSESSIECSIKGPVCVVVDPWDLPYNGTVVSSRRFVDALRLRGLDFRILSCIAEGGKGQASANSDAIDPAKGKLERCYFPKLSIPGVNGIIRSMKVMLARSRSKVMDAALENADVLHVQFPFFLGYSAIKKAREKQIPIVCSFHVQPENLLLNLGLNFKWLRELLYKIFIHFIYNRADLVIAPSQFAADELLARNLVKPIEVVSNGVPELFFKNKKTYSAKPEGSVFRVLSVGRFSGEKQQSLLIEAIAKSKHCDVILLELVGAGPNEARLKAQIRRSGINAIIGTVSDDELLKSYREADLFVHCGIIELEGMSVVEAMASGNAVLVSDSIDSAAGVFALDELARFKSGDVKDLAQKLDYWVEQPEHLAEMASKNLDYIQTYRHEACVDKLLSLYASLKVQTNVARSGCKQSPS